MLLKNIMIVVTIVSTLLSGVVMYSNWKYAGRLRSAQALVTSYAAEAKAANARSELAEVHAAESEAESAKSQEAAKASADQARAAHAQLAKIRAAVPNGGTTLDIIAANLAAVRDSLATTQAEAASWQSAYESQLAATAKLQVSNDSLKSSLKDVRDASTKLQGASTDLVKASGESFWKRISPKFTVGATVGVDSKGNIKPVVGIGVGYTL